MADLPWLYLPYLLDIVAQGLAVAVIAYASQCALLTKRDSPVIVIVFAALSILLFTLPRIAGNSRIPHILIIIFGLTTILAFLFDVVHNDCGLDTLLGKPPNLPSDPVLCCKASITWWLDLVLFVWIILVLLWNAWQARVPHPVEELTPDPEREPDQRTPLLE